MRSESTLEETGKSSRLIDDPLLDDCPTSGRQGRFLYTELMDSTMAEGVTPSNILNRMERLPFTSYQMLFVITMAFGLFFDQYNIAEISTTITPMAHIFAFTKFDTTFVIASAFIGNFFGAIFSGYLSDRLGRRRLFIYTLILIVIGSFLTAASQNLTEVIIFRIIAGFGVGGDLPIVWAYMSELVPATKRGRWFGMALPIGLSSYVISAFASYLLVPTSIDGWRWVYVIGGLIALAIWPIRYLTPESPRYLLSKGKVAEAEQTLLGIEMKVKDRYGKDLPKPTEDSNLTISTEKIRYGELFSKEQRTKTIQVTLLQIFQVLAFFGFSSFITIILVSRGFTLVHAIEFTAISDVGLIVGAASQIVWGDRVQRRTLMSVGAFLAAVFVTLFALSNTAIEIVVFGFLFNFSTQVFFTAISTYTPEIFPTRLRASASGFSYGVGRAFNLFGIFFIGIALAGLPLFQTVFVAVAYLLVSLIAILMGGKTTGIQLEKLSEVKKNS